MQIRNFGQYKRIENHNNQRTRCKDTEPKIPISPIQEESLLSFEKSDKVYYKYYDEFIILLGTGFLFITRNGTPKICTNYDIMFRRLVEKYNKSHEEALPVVTTPHTLWHTFCTNMANSGMNPRALQYLMWDTPTLP